MTYDLVPLSELGEIVSGSTPDTFIQDYWGGDIPWITPADLTNHEGVYFSGELRKITEAGYRSCSTKILPPGSILFSSRAPIGHCAVTTFPLCTNQGFKSIIPNDRLDAVYGLFALKYFTPSLQALGRGATFTEINKEIFGDFVIPLPPLDEQRRIAAILQRADRLRRLRRLSRQLSDTFLQSVFLQMFGDPATNPRKLPVVEIQDVTQSLDSKRIPVEASIRRIRKGEYPYYGASGIIDYIDNYLFEEETLLVAEDGANLLTRSTPIAFIVSGKYWVNNHAHVLRVLGGVNIQYLRYTLNATDLKSIVTGTAQPKLTAGNLSALKIMRPAICDQDAFAYLVEKHDFVYTYQLEASRQSEQLFQTLLARAFSEI